jgi:hypothetical protein
VKHRCIASTTACQPHQLASSNSVCLKQQLAACAVLCQHARTFEDKTVVWLSCWMHAGAGNNITHRLHSGNASTNSCVFVFTCVQELCCLCKLICCCINHRWLTPDARPTAAVPVQTMTGDTKTSSVSLQGERFCLVKSCEATMQWEIPNQSDMSVT